jgi:Ca-dependent carbohydrate-binding module xylan-binding
MRIATCVSLVAVGVVFLPVLGTAGGDAKPLIVELKSFTFKAPNGKEDLLKYSEFDEKLAFYINGTAEAKIDVPKEGDYTIVIKASGDKALKEGAKFKVTVDGKPSGKETETSEGEPKEYLFAMPLKAGQHKLAIEFTNDVFKEGEYDRNLFVHAVALKKVK